jgi:hypothetical protein
MPTDNMDPTTAVTYGPFIQAAEAQYSSDPSQVNPAAITNMPAGYTLVRTIQMTTSSLRSSPGSSTGTWR